MLRTDNRGVEKTVSARIKNREVIHFLTQKENYQHK